MPGKTRPYEQFGPYVLFKKLESDPLGELWRAALIEDRHLGPLMALRRLTGGDREALAQNAMEAHAVASLLDGTSFAKRQAIDVIDGIPFVVHEYEGGRSLRHIVDRARGGSGITPNPIPIDQALLIAEKVALSLETVAELRNGSQRLAHGALIPQFVWISEDGEIRVAGQQLGKGLLASLKDAKVAASIGRFFSPEYQHSTEPAKSSEVFSVGAILFLLVTGHEPPDAASVSAFGQTIRAAKTMAGLPLPDDIRAIVDKSLAIDPARRYESVGHMKQALAALAHGGTYPATTFNLAFYLSSLLKKETEGEAIDREKESKINIAPYLEAVVASPPPPAPASAGTPARRTLVPIAAALTLAAVVGGAYIVMKGSPSSNASARVASGARPSPAFAKTTAPPTVVENVPLTPAAPGTVDPAAQKKAFENAVNQKLQEEMGKLQAQFNKEQQKAQPSPAPAPAEVLTTSAPAATIDQRRPAATREVAAAAPAQTLPTEPQAQPVPVQLQPQAPAPAPAPVPVPVPAPVPSIHEGDVVNFDELDVRPQAISTPRVVYPPVAMRQRVETSLILTVFVSETGDVLDVKVLRGDARFGFNEEAIRALRSMKFRPAMKDGKRVRTWIPQPVQFKLQ